MSCTGGFGRGTSFPSAARQARRGGRRSIGPGRHAPWWRRAPPAAFHQAGPARPLRRAPPASFAAATPSHSGFLTVGIQRAGIRPFDPPAARRPPPAAATHILLYCHRHSASGIGWRWSSKKPGPPRLSRSNPLGQGPRKGRVGQLSVGVAGQRQGRERCPEHAIASSIRAEKRTPRPEARPPPRPTASGPRPESEREAPRCPVQQAAPSPTGLIFESARLTSRF